MNHDERKHLETNALAEGLETFWDRAKSGKLNYRLIGLVLAIVVVGIVLYVVTYETRKASSETWAGLIKLDRSGTASQREDFIKINAKDTPGRLARMDNARELLGKTGIGRLASKDKDERNKGIANVEKAREEFLALAEELKSDKTLQTAALVSAVEAELALVGIPKEGGGSEQRGSPKKAAELLRKAAGIIGETTPIGEQYKKRAEDLDKNAAEIIKVGEMLNKSLAPLPSFTVPTPGEGPKSPEGILPKIDAPKADGPKAPDGPIIPPPVTPVGEPKKP